MKEEEDIVGYLLRVDDVVNTMRGLGEKIDEKFASTLMLVNAIDTNKPFDELIGSGNAAKEKIVKDAVFSLQELGDLLVEGAAGIGISFVADLED